MSTTKNCLILVLLLVISGCSDSPRSASSPPRQNYTPKDSWEGDTPFIMPGIDRPPTVAADATELPDDTPVIGITAGTRHRAYSLKAMTNVATHVLNDVVDGVPVSVTYCDRTDMGRCFTRAGAKSPLDLQLGGWRDQKVLLKLKNQYYAHDATNIPLLNYEFERATWGEWRSAHPDTDLFEKAAAYPGAEPGVMKKISTVEKVDATKPSGENTVSPSCANAEAVENNSETTEKDARQNTESVKPTDDGK